MLTQPFDSDEASATSSLCTFSFARLDNEEQKDKFTNSNKNLNLNQSSSRRKLNSRSATRLIIILQLILLMCLNCPHLQQQPSDCTLNASYRLASKRANNQCKSTFQLGYFVAATSSASFHVDSKQNSLVQLGIKQLNNGQSKARLAPQPSSQQNDASELQVSTGERKHLRPARQAENVSDFVGNQSSDYEQDLDDIDSTKEEEEKVGGGSRKQQAVALSNAQPAISANNRTQKVEEGRAEGEREREREGEREGKAAKEVAASSSPSSNSALITSLFSHIDKQWKFAEVILIIVISAILNLVTIIGNIMVLISFKMDRSLQTVSNYFLLSLALADLLIGLISMPLYTLYLLLNYWPLGPLMCDIWLAIDYLNSNAAVLNMLIISFDRYFSVTRPLTYRARRTTKHACLMISCAWILSLTIWTPAIFFYPYYKGRTVQGTDKCEIEFVKANTYLTFVTAILAFYIPVIIMIYLYWRIWLETKKRYRDLTTLFLVSGVGAAAPARSTRPIHQVNTASSLALVHRANSMRKSPPVVLKRSPVRVGNNNNTNNNDSNQQQKQQESCPPHFHPPASPGKMSKIGTGQLGGQIGSCSKRIPSNFCSQSRSSGSNSGSSRSSSISSQKSIFTLRKRNTLAGAPLKSISTNQSGAGERTQTQMGVKCKCPYCPRTIKKARTVKRSGKNCSSRCPAQVNEEPQSSVRCSFSPEGGNFCDNCAATCEFCKYLRSRPAKLMRKRKTVEGNESAKVDNCLADGNEKLVQPELPGDREGEAKERQRWPASCQANHHHHQHHNHRNHHHHHHHHHRNHRAHHSDSTCHHHHHHQRERNQHKHNHSHQVHEQENLRAARNMQCKMSNSNSIFASPSPSTSSICNICQLNDDNDNNNNNNTKPNASIPCTCKPNNADCFGEIKSSLINSAQQLLAKKSPSLTCSSSGCAFIKRKVHPEAGQVSALKLAQQMDQEETGMIEFKTLDASQLSQRPKRILVDVALSPIQFPSSPLDQGHYDEEEEDVYERNFETRIITAGNRFKFESKNINLSPIIRSISGGGSKLAAREGNHCERKSCNCESLKCSYSQCRACKNTAHRRHLHHQPSKLCNSACRRCEKVQTDAESQNFTSFGIVVGEKNDDIERTKLKPMRDDIGTLISGHTGGQVKVNCGPESSGNLLQSAGEQPASKSSIRDESKEGRKRAGKKFSQKLTFSDILVAAERSTFDPQVNCSSSQTSSAEKRPNGANKSVSLTTSNELANEGEENLQTGANGANWPRISSHPMEWIRRLFGWPSGRGNRLVVGDNSSPAAAAAAAAPPASTLFRRTICCGNETGRDSSDFRSTTGKRSSSNESWLQKHLASSDESEIGANCNNNNSSNNTNTSNSSTSKQQHHPIQPKSERKAAKTLSTLLLVFIVTWLPYNVLVLIKTLSGGEDQVPEKIWNFSYYLCYINSTINPLCYALCNAQFRRTYMRILKCKLSNEHNSTRRLVPNLQSSTTWNKDLRAQIQQQQQHHLQLQTNSNNLEPVIAKTN